MPPDEREPNTLLDRRLPPRFHRRTVVIPADLPHGPDDVEWADALVIVESGRLEVETEAGTRARFDTGGVLSLAGLAPRALRGCDGAPAVLVVISRRGSAGAA